MPGIGISNLTGLRTGLFARIKSSHAKGDDFLSSDSLNDAVLLAGSEYSLNEGGSNNALMNTLIKLFIQNPEYIIDMDYALASLGIFAEEGLPEAFAFEWDVSNVNNTDVREMFGRFQSRPAKPQPMTASGS